MKNQAVGNSIIKGCGTHHIAVQTRNLAASMRLYQDVLGMKVVAEFGSPQRKIILLDMGDGSHIELFEPTIDTPRGDEPVVNDPVTHFALTTTDARAALEHVRQEGYEVTSEPRDLVLGELEVTVAFFKGPSGESIEFFQTH